MFWRNLLHRNRMDREWREEMESHIQMLTDSFLVQGLKPREARSAALKQAGNLTARREEIYSMNGIQWLDSIASDLRYALRGLRNQPSFTAVAVLTVALGIGANTAVFSVVNSVLLKPLPYPDAEELVNLGQIAPGAGGLISSHGLPLSTSMYFTYTEQNRSFQSMGVWISRPVSVTGLGEPEQVFADVISDGMLQALAVQPEIGRPLTAADQAPGASGTVLLSYGYWQRRFGGDRSVIGRKILVDAVPREIVGVMPTSFRIADTPADLILPLQLDRRQAILEGFYLKSVARLKPGVSIDRANADIARLLPIWVHSWASTPAGTPGDGGLAEKLFLSSWRIGPNIRPLRESVVGNVRSVLWVVMGTLAMVMLIACANVANLLLVRIEARQSELAVRAALGAGWTRIVRQLLVESLLLGGAGGALGLAIAYGGLRVLVRNGPSNLPRLSEIGLDSHVLAFTAIVSLVSSLFFGLIPALRYGRNVSLSVRASGRTMSQSRERHRARSTLVVVQVSLALVLLICSGLMIRTFQAMRSVRPGFEQPDQVQTFRVVLPQTLIPKDEQVTRTEQAIAEKLAAIPGVTSVGFASALPMDSAPPNWDGILKEGQSYAQGNHPVMRLYVNVAPGLFGSLGTTLKAGRDLTWTDIYAGRKFVLVSENLAHEMWGSAQAAVGKRVRAGDNDVWREVVGVVEDVRYFGSHESAPAIVYWPIFGQLHYAPITVAARAVAFTIRTNRAGTGALLNEIREAVWSVNAALAVANPETLRETVDHSMARTSFTLVMLAIAGAMALLLGLIGIYGVIAYAVSQRTREIGIRLALGARPADVRQMFVRYGLSLCAIGITIGVVAASVLTRVMKSLLFGVTPMDPMTFAAVPFMLLAATLAASYLPAKRVSAVDPLKSLKAE
ncbi:MAG TPA: ABC transporter permease [Bryobacteraceae bacterium]|nr:ABC transporter permease [Bryobacteraceae bacterium]